MKPDDERVLHVSDKEDEYFGCLVYVESVENMDDYRIYNCLVDAQEGMARKSYHWNKLGGYYKRENGIRKEIEVHLNGSIELSNGNTVQYRDMVASKGNICLGREWHDICGQITSSRQTDVGLSLVISDIWHPRLLKALEEYEVGRVNKFPWYVSLKFLFKDSAEFMMLSGGYGYKPMLFSQDFKVLREYRSEWSMRVNAIYVKFEDFLKEEKDNRGGSA